MHLATTLAVAGSLLSCTEALQVQKRTDGPARVLQLDTFRKRSAYSPTNRDRLRRRAIKTLNVALDNQQSLYFTNVTIGTPGQSLRLDIDTGSSDLWANTDSSSLCTKQGGEYCAISGTYNANDSSTYEYVNPNFLIKYADGSQVSGDYAKDTVTMGNIALQSVQFGIGYTSTSSQGILGIGYMTDEAITQTTGKTYTNFPQQLVDDGVIATNAYSLWLNDLDATQGSILFGGVDTAKYTGTLSTVPILKEQGVYREMMIALSGLSANGQTLVTEDEAFSVLLDSGSTLSYLPDNVAQSIYTIFNAQYNSNDGSAIVDCDIATNNPSVTVDFSFSGVNISVPLDELVLTEVITPRRTTCVLGISSAGSSSVVLGDTFLRSAYVVYDLENNEISLAQTVFNATASSVEEITSGSSGVPNAVAVASPVTSVTVSETGGRNPSQASATLTAAASTAKITPGLWVALAAVFGLFVAAS